MVAVELALAGTRGAMGALDEDFAQGGIALSCSPFAATIRNGLRGGDAAAGARVDFPQTLLHMAPIGLRRFERYRDDSRDGLTSAMRLDRFTALNLSENGREMALDVADVERFHVRQSA